MKITLTEFCKKLSLSDKRVELIGGFHSWMRNTEKTTKATESEFKENYDKFIKMSA